MAKTYEIAFKLGAQMAGNFAKTMTSATGSLGELNNKIGQLNKQQSAIQSLVKLRTAVANNSRAYMQAQERVSKLAREIKNTTNPSKTLTREFEKAKRQASQLKGKLSEERLELVKLNRTMGTTSESTSDLIKRQKNLAASAEKAKKAQGSLQSAMASRDANLEKRSQKRGQLFDAVALGASVVAFTSGAREISKAQGELATLSVSDKGLGAITKMAVEMSNQYAGVTAPDFIKASYDIRSGIESLSEVAVGKFTKIAALTAAATKSTTGEMTNLFSKGYGIYRKEFDSFGAEVVQGWNNLSAEEKDVKFGESFSAGISAAVKQYRTDGAQMSQAFSNLGANATVFGHTMEDQIATLGALQKTMAGAESSTKYRAFLRGATKAQEKLNLSFTDSNGNLKSTVGILTEIQKAYGKNMSAEDIAEINQAFGGDEAGSFISALITDIDGLKTGSDAVAESMKRGAAATREMANAGQKGKEFELLQQRLSNASSAISLGLMPAILPLTEKMGEMAQAVGAAAQKYPQLTTLIGAAAVGLIALKVATIAGGYAFTFVKGAVLSAVIAYKTLRVAYLLATGATIANTTASKASIVISKIMTAAQWLFNTALGAAKWTWSIAKMLAYKTAQLSVSMATKALAASQWLLNTAVGASKWTWATAKMLAYKTAQISVSVATKAMAAAQWLLNVAMSANPIGLVIIAVAGLIAAGVALYKNWDKVTAFFSAAWQRIKNLFASFNPLSWIMAGLNKLHAWLSGFSLYSSGLKLLKTFASGIKAAASAPIAAVKGALAKVRSYLPFSDAKVGPLSELTKSGQAVLTTMRDGMAMVSPNTMMQPFNKAMGGMAGGATLDTSTGRLSGANAGGSSLGTAGTRLNSASAGGQTPAAGGSGIVLHLTQKINVGGGGGSDTQTQAKAGAAAGADDIVQKLQRAMNQERRLSYV